MKHLGGRQRGRGSNGGQRSRQAIRQGERGKAHRILPCGRAALAAVLVGLAGCYDTPRPVCGFACGAEASCPDGYVCGGNNRCRIPDAEDDDCIAPPEAGPMVDAPPPDAGPMDAPAVSCPDLNPASDGSGRQELSLAELSPTVFVELFNDTDVDLALAQGGWALAARDQTYRLAELAPAATVPARGYKSFAWPAALLAGDTGGELALYRDIAVAADFDDAARLVAYACWGSDAAIARKALAEAAGKWSGDCAAALTMSALRRKPATTGAVADSYDPAVAAEQTSCAP
jgi:hypothetical protein